MTAPLMDPYCWVTGGRSTTRHLGSCSHVTRPSARGRHATTAEMAALAVCLGCGAAGSTATESADVTATDRPQICQRCFTVPTLSGPCNCE